MNSIPEKDLARIHELAEEYDVDVDTVFALYEIMPNELYDGIVNALEDSLEGVNW